MDSPPNKQEVLDAFHSNLPVEYKTKNDTEWKSYHPFQSEVPPPTDPKAWENIEWRKHKMVGFY